MDLLFHSELNSEQVDKEQLDKEQLDEEQVYRGGVKNNSNVARLQHLAIPLGLGLGLFLHTKNELENECPMIDGKKYDKLLYAVRKDLGHSKTVKKVAK